MVNGWNNERTTPLDVKKVKGEAGEEEIDAARARQSSGIKIEMKLGDWRKFFSVNLQERMLVISVNYTNAKLAEGLKQEGVPLIIDESAEDSATKSIAKKMKLERTTVQKALKNLLNKQLVRRVQCNLSRGGYVFMYEPNKKEYLKNAIKDIIYKWYKSVEKEIDRW